MERGRVNSRLSAYRRKKDEAMKVCTEQLVGTNPERSTGLSRKRAEKSRLGLNYLKLIRGKHRNKSMTRFKQLFKLCRTRKCGLPQGE